MVLLIIVFSLLKLCSWASSDKSVHIFYYGWYGTPEVDGKWNHWNHDVMPHWKESTNEKHPNIGQTFEPDLDEVGSTFYPRDGLYSSRDLEVVKRQFLDLQAVGVDVVVISWHGPWGKATGHDSQTHLSLSTMFEAAESTGTKLAIHLEPYVGRTYITLVTDVMELLTRYRNSTALARMNGLPVFYVYDSYHLSKEEWAQFFEQIRGSIIDGFFIGLYLDELTVGHLEKFNGFYTYFAHLGREDNHGVNHPRLWWKLQREAADKKQVFIPTVGPGYNDLKIRPWNTDSLVERDSGAYYSRMWDFAVKSLHGDTISITSFNEWGEGTQIEPAVAKPGYETPDIDYMEKTKELIENWRKADAKTKTEL